MPTYDYKCSCGFEKEVFYGISEEPEVTCDKCKKMNKAITGGGYVIYRGSGFYSTDYRKKND